MTSHLCRTFFLFLLVDITIISFNWSEHRTCEAMPGHNIFPSMSDFHLCTPLLNKKIRTLFGLGNNVYYGHLTVGYGNKGNIPLPCSVTSVKKFILFGVVYGQLTRKICFPPHSLIAKKKMLYKWLKMGQRFILFVHEGSTYSLHWHHQNNLYRYCITITSEVVVINGS